MHVPATRMPALPDLDALRPARPAGPAAPSPASAPPAAPAAARATERGGALWDVLTPEEQAFFRERDALGPLTYGRAVAAPDPGPAPGARLDVRG